MAVSLSFRLKIIYTGGTLGMQSSEQGLVPATGLAERLKEQLETMPGYRQQLSGLKWTLTENTPLLDSANISPPDWEAIADQCRQSADYQAVVIIHGTDTLAYTAAALSYFLQSTDIPVLLTGSQKPLGASGGDALSNLAGAMRESVKAPRGVWVYFHHKLMPGARVVKKDAISFAGFDTPRLSGTLDDRQSLEQLDWQARPGEWASIRIVTSQMLPGYDADQLNTLISSHPDAIILSLYGLGTLPDQNTDLLNALASANRQGIIVAAISQCYIGLIDFSVYATGARLVSTGVLDGWDMTLEAAYTKLMVLFRLGYSVEETRQLFEQNLANELTRPLK